jgi:hypothetical protein
MASSATSHDKLRLTIPTDAGIFRTGKEGQE